MIVVEETENFLLAAWPRPPAAKELQELYDKYRWRPFCPPQSHPSGYALMLFRPHGWWNE